MFIDTPDRLGGLIHTRRQALGTSQRDLALAVNAGERFIVDLEGGNAFAWPCIFDHPV